ncbi:MAG: hypothetical protein NC202_13080 [Roseburia sp.]|nr:hypothetical protein [Roseburia sp.]
MDEFISRKEHTEFSRRIDEENNRQNRRIELLENTSREMNALASSVEKLATNMESMVKGQEKQDARLEALEGRDGEKWRKVVSHVGTTVLGIVLAYIAMKLGLG